MLALNPIIAVRSGSTTSKTLRVNGLIVTHACFPRLATRSHAHELATCTLTLEGSWQERRIKRVDYCKPGTLVTKRAGEVHKDEFAAPGVRVVMIEVDESSASGAILSSLQALERAGCIADHGTLWLGNRIAQELTDPDRATPLIVEGLLLELLGVATRRHQAPPAAHVPAWLKRALDFIQSDYLNPTAQIRVTDVARVAEVHPVYLTRAFRKYVGCSPGDYLRHARLEWAATQLATTDQSVAQVAAQAGFADQSHFTRQFKRHSGMTPALFRAASVGYRNR